MAVHRTDSHLEQRMRAHAQALRVDGFERIKSLSWHERRKFQSIKSKLYSNEAPLPPLDTWRNCLRDISINMEFKCKRLLLPAVEASTRIEQISSWIWQAGEAALSADGLIRLTEICSKASPLMYKEIWLLPYAIRLQAIRSFLSDSQMLIHMTHSYAAGQAYRSGMQWISGDAIFAETVIRRGIDSESELTLQDIYLHINQSGEDPEVLIDQSHEQQSELALRLDRAARLLRLLDTINWQDYIERLSQTERLLLQDPGGIYPDLSQLTKQQIRDSVVRLSRLSNKSETEVAATAGRICRECHIDDISQVFLKDNGLNQLQKALHIPPAKRFRIYRDPHGKKTVFINLIACIAFSVSFILLGGSYWGFVLGMPVFWQLSRQLLNRIASSVIPMIHLPQMHWETVPESHRTLVVVPAKISNTRELTERIDELHTHGIRNIDSAMDFLLLADLPDHSEEISGEDAPIFAKSYAEIERLNAQMDEPRYFVLWRNRVFNKYDGNYQAYERKRGALMDLYAVLCGEKRSFQPEAASSILQKRKFRYVITLDAGTVVYPDSFKSLAATMAWPGNPYTIIQPCMHDMLKMHPSALDKIIAPNAGINSYASSAGDVYQNLTGRGIFGGKGIVDISAFRLSVENRLPENAILSHDLIEGALAGAGYTGDVHWFEQQPGTINGYLSRLERWTRGDWQLLPFLLDASEPLDSLTRFQMADNLLRSLSYPATILMLFLAVLNGSSIAAVFPLAYWLCPVLLHLSSIKQENMLNVLMHIGLMPLFAWNITGAIARALYRTYVSHSHMLDWKTSSSADIAGKIPMAPGFVAAAVMLCGSFTHPAMGPGFLALALLFAISPFWVSLCSKHVDRPDPAPLQKEYLLDIATRTWKFFGHFVTAEDHWLPPDNVQLDPATGTAHRTSPTNIGMYLTAALSAEMLGIIDHAELLQRIRNTLDTLEQMPKWNGHLYNWHDTLTLQPLSPRYVSSVDSGNLATCLLTISAADIDEDLKQKAYALASEIDFQSLFDKKRLLFRIGVDPDTGEPSASHYDLYASESRLLSLTAIALNQIPARHWQKLGRPFTSINKKSTMISWSGTMFEYLMPDLFFSAPEGSAWTTSAQSVVNLHMARPINKLWGVSESGHHEFDLHMNYQYRAFGLHQLSYQNNAQGGVIAPYSAALALKYQQKPAAEVLIEACKQQYISEYGLFEAIDYRTGEPQAVKSHMAHHQGMILCAIANALCSDHLCQLMLKHPQYRALQPLFQEIAPIHVAKRLPLPGTTYPTRRQNIGSRESRSFDFHMMRGAESTYWTDGIGNSRLSMKGIIVNRWLEAPEREPDCIGLYLKSDHSQLAVNYAPNIRITLQPGSVRRTLLLSELKLKTVEALSPEDGTWFQTIEIENCLDHAQTVAITSAFPVAMMTMAEMRAHPLFHNLFVKSRRTGQHAIGFHRRSRETTPDDRLLMHAAFGAEQAEWETDATKFYGRTLTAASPDLADRILSGSLGHMLHPCSAIRTTIHLSAGERRTIHFAIGVVKDGDEGDWIHAHEDLSAAQRAICLAESQAQALLSFSGIQPSNYVPIERAAARLVFPGNKKAIAACRKQDLWKYGISGDRALIGCRISAMKDMDMLNKILHIHQYYRFMGIEADLILFTNLPEGYYTPFSDRIGDMIHNNENVYQIDESLSANDAAWSACSLQIDASSGQLWNQFAAQYRRKKSSLLPIYENLSTQTPCKFPENGYGSFNSNGYEIITSQVNPTPAPWSNILAQEGFGTLITERGGGYTWAGNSQSMRLTRFWNQFTREGWSERISLILPEKGARIDALPYPENPLAFRVIHNPAYSRFLPICPEYPFETTVFLADNQHVKLYLLRDLENNRLHCAEFHIDWLMGSTPDDARYVYSHGSEGICFAQGNMDGIGYLTCICGKHLSASSDGSSIRASFSAGQLCFALGWAATEQQARQQIKTLRAVDPQKLLQEAESAAQNRFSCLKITTPDDQMNIFFNSFLPHQVFASRIYGRTGLYQGGGAFGFRDQLQDMLCAMIFDPDLARRHILDCAAHQFQSGDVLHWWHPPYRGVRTHISDDMLFLPYVASIYAAETGDFRIWDVPVTYLTDEPIPAGAHDRYFEAKPSAETGSLREHCIRAMERAYQTGEHGLLKIGGGDWNDGMNRVGAKGRGESVWLSQFMCHVIDLSEGWMPADKAALWKARRTALSNAIEINGWDGEWYLRAYDDQGNKLGSHECDAVKIDCITQAWAQITGLDSNRVAAALSSAKSHLVDSELGIIRLLSPAFDMDASDPGYIRAYPPGVRENGGQYTHAACWLLRAYARNGDISAAWQLLHMLLPYNHAKTPEAAARYRVEPYVMAADISAEGHAAGRGGWTWYTGSAAWMYRVFLQDILGFERRGAKVRLNMLPLPGWDHVHVQLQYKSSRYFLRSSIEAACVLLDGCKQNDDWIEMTDDGREHQAEFPARKP